MGDFSDSALEANVWGWLVNRHEDNLDNNRLAHLLYFYKDTGESSMKEKAKYPIKNEDGTWNWKNLFRPDWKTILFVIWLLYMIWAYRHDTEVCRDFAEEPGKYCDGYCNAKFMYLDGSNEPSLDFLIEDEQIGTETN